MNFVDFVDSLFNNLIYFFHFWSILNDFNIGFGFLCFCNWVEPGNVLALFYFFILKLFKIVFGFFLLVNHFFGKVIGCVKKTSLYLLQHVCLSLCLVSIFFSKFFWFIIILFIDWMHYFHNNYSRRARLMSSLLS